VQALAQGQLNGVVESNPRFGPLAFQTVEKFLSGDPIPQKIIIQDRIYTPRTPRRTWTRPTRGRVLEHENSVLELRRGTKRFPGVLALDDVSFGLMPARCAPSSGRTARASPL
jgi:hypothetical protein